MTVPNEGKEALEWIMNEGHFDEIRKKVMETLRNNDDLKQFTTQMLEDSQTIAQADLQQANKKKILDDLRKELEDKLLNRAADYAWSVMNDPQDSICSLIEEKVHEALCTIYEKRAAEQEQRR